MQELECDLIEEADITPLEKIATGVPGLDEVLHGGLPRGCPSLVFGGPGTGKTLLGFAFVKSAACTVGEPVVFASFEQSADEVRRHARSIGLKLESWEEHGAVVVMGRALAPVDGLTAEQEMGQLYDEIAAACDRIDARHIVLDGLDLYTALLDDPAKERAELVFIRRWATERGMTVLATAKSSPQGQSPQNFEDFLNFGVDCSIRVFSTYDGYAFARKLEVIKYRGSGFWAGQHALHLGPQGFSLSPLPRVQLVEKGEPDHFSTGNDYFDRVLGGGLLRGSTNMFAGPTGSGKSVFVDMVVHAALRRGERVLRLGFESPTVVDSPIASGASRSFAANGADADLYRLMAVLPESVNAEDLLFELLETMRDFKPDILVVDSASACRRMGSEETAHSFLVRLIGRARLAGITRILTHLVAPGHADLTIAGNNLNPQVAAIVRLDLLFQWPRLKRQLLVIKSRGSNHSRDVHSFSIGPHGLEIPAHDHTPQRSSR